MNRELYKQRLRRIKINKQTNFSIKVRSSIGRWCGVRIRSVNFQQFTAKYARCARTETEPPSWPSPVTRDRRSLDTVQPEHSAEHLNNVKQSCELSVARPFRRRAAGDPVSEMYGSSMSPGVQVGDRTVLEWKDMQRVWAEASSGTLPREGLVGVQSQRQGSRFFRGNSPLLRLPFGNPIYRIVAIPLLPIPSVP